MKAKREKKKKKAKESGKQQDRDSSNARGSEHDNQHIFVRNLGGQMTVRYIQIAEDKNYQPRVLAKLTFKSKGEMKIFLDK